MRYIRPALLISVLITAMLAVPVFASDRNRVLQPGNVINSRVDRLMSIVDEGARRPESVHGKTVKWKGVVQSVDHKGSVLSMVIKTGGDEIVRAVSLSDIEAGNIEKGGRVTITGRLVEKAGIFSHVEIISLRVFPKKQGLAPLFGRGGRKNASGGFVFFPKSKPLEISNEETAKRLSCWITTFPNGLSKGENRSIARWIVQYSRKYNIDWRLAASMIAAESSFRIDAVSPVGAMGLGQLMPGTAKLLNVKKPFDPRENIRGSLFYLSDLVREWKGYGDQYSRALAGYNAGPHRVRQYNGVPPYRETKDYIRAVNRYYNELAPESEECVYKRVTKKKGKCPTGDCCKKAMSAVDRL